MAHQNQTTTAGPSQLGLIMSERGTSSSSLLYQSALTCAALGQHVLVVLHPDGRWSSLPPTGHTMAEMSPDIMKNISFLYPHNLAELIRHIASPAGTTGGGLGPPQAVMVGNIEKMIETTIREGGGEVTDTARQVEHLARISALLGQFLEDCGRLGERDEEAGRQPSRLLVTAELDKRMMSQCEKRMFLWYTEMWRLAEPNADQPHHQLTCLSSHQPVSVQYYVRDNEMFLVSIIGPSN